LAKDPEIPKTAEEKSAIPRPEAMKPWLAPGAFRASAGLVAAAIVASCQE
jgi:hypothetical protein